MVSIGFLASFSSQCILVVNILFQTESESSKDLAYEYLDIEMARKTISERVSWFFPFHFPGHILFVIHAILLQDTRNPLEPTKELISDLSKYESDEDNFIYEGNANAFVRAGCNSK